MSYQPRKIDYYLQRPRNHNHWFASQRRAKKTPLKDVQAAFPVRGGMDEKAGRRETATRWATGAEREWDCKAKKYVSVSPWQPEIVTVPNEPRAGFKVVGVESRGNGGRAWKVLTPEGYLVDLPEEHFIPILLDRGLPAGPLAEIPARLVWVCEGSQTRLQDYDIPDFAELYETEDQLDAKKSAATNGRDLVVGGIYQSASGDTTQVYLGRVRFTPSDGYVKPPQPRYAFHRSYYEKEMEARKTRAGKLHWAFLDLGWFKPQDPVAEAKAKLARSRSGGHPKVTVKTGGKSGRLIGKIEVDRTGLTRFEANNLQFDDSEFNWE